MNTSFEKSRLNLAQLMSQSGAEWLDGCEPHITFDANVEPQYYIVRQTTHDGTCMFSMDMFQSAMQPLLYGLSYYKPMGLPPDGCDVVYTVGEARHVSVFGKVSLPCGRYPGMRERIRIPVKCEYEQKEPK
jgi:hypothetical protein